LTPSQTRSSAESRSMHMLVNSFLHGVCLVAQMSMRTRTTFPLTQ